MSTLAIATEPTDVIVRVQDATKPIASARSPLSVSVPRGARIEIDVDASGYEPAAKSITIGDTEQQAVMLSLVPRTRPVPSPSTSDPNSGAAPIAKPALTSPRALRPPTKRTEPEDKIFE